MRYPAKGLDRYIGDGARGAFRAKPDFAIRTGPEVVFGTLHNELTIYKTGERGSIHDQIGRAHV